METILLAGAGGHCRSCIEVIESCGHFQIAGMIGKSDEVGKQVLGYPVIGSDQDWKSFRREHSNALVATGQIKSAESRLRIYCLLNELGFSLPVVVAATAVVSRHCRIGAGSIVMHGAIVNAGAVVGKNAIINSRALIEHDSTIADHCHISTGAIVNGAVTVGEKSFIGSGAVICEGVKIGDGAVVGAHALVVRDLPDNTVLRGQA